MSSIFCGFTTSPLILRESLSESQNNKLEEKSVPAYPAHLVKQRFSIAPRSVCTFKKKQQEGAICAPTACECCNV